MYMPLREVLANAPKAGWLAIAKQNWEKVPSDPWVLQTVQGYSLELVTAPTQVSPVIYYNCILFSHLLFACHISFVGSIVMYVFNRCL